MTKNQTTEIQQAIYAFSGACDESIIKINIKFNLHHTV